MKEVVRRNMGEAAVKAARAAGYQGAGTVEFLVEASRELAPNNFYFMEMNTRLQVEHPVTEAITGQDLVEWQFRIALGEPLPLSQHQIRFSGHAIEARLYAEDAGHGFRPQTGRITHLRLADDDARVDTGIRQGDEITSHYDPLIAKIIAHGPTREEAFRKLARALDLSWVAGCTTNLEFLRALIAHPDVKAGHVETGLIERSIASLTAQPRLTNGTIAIAALAALHLLDEMEGCDPWSALTGWRAWGEAESFVELALDEDFGPEDFAREEFVSLRAVSLGRDAFRVEWGDVSVRCTLLSRDGDRIRFDIGNRIREAAILGTGQQVSIHVEGATHTFNRPGPVTSDVDRHPPSDEISSPISGLVRAVRVSAGEAVKKGAALVIIEAMKMEHTVVAPRDATIAEVRVALGDQVDETAVMLVLKEDAGSMAASP
jgi:3-methylcrotonyl-CoA carboxylase alpha subunit